MMTPVVDFYVRLRRRNPTIWLTIFYLKGFTYKVIYYNKVLV